MRPASQSNDFRDQSNLNTVVAFGIIATVTSLGLAIAVQGFIGNLLSLIPLVSALVFATLRSRRRPVIQVLQPSLIDGFVNVLSVGSGIQSALALTLKETCRRFGATGGFIALLPDNEVSDFITQTKFASSDLDFPESIPADGFLVESLGAGKPFIQTASHAMPCLSSDCILQSGSMVAAPITIHLRRQGATAEPTIVGALVLLFDSAERLDEDLKESVSDLVAVLSLAIAPSWHRKHVQQTLTATLELLVTMFEDRSDFTRGHSKRVSELSIELGKRLGLRDESLEDLKLGALLHDIGKIAIPETILNKKGVLSEEELFIVQQHAAIGFEMCSHVQLPDCVLRIIRNHHENLDGTGYPDQLSGSALTLYIRIVAVAESFDAMCSRHAYREPMALEKVVAELMRHAGTRFDPLIVEELRKLLDERQQANQSTQPSSKEQVA